jgi:hypothetical protein
MMKAVWTCDIIALTQLPIAILLAFGSCQFHFELWVVEHLVLFCIALLTVFFEILVVGG